MDLLNLLLVKPEYYVPLGIVVSLAVYFLLRFTLARGLKQSIKDDTLRFRVLRGTKFGLNALLLITLFQLVAGDSWSTASFLGLLSAGIAFVFREPILNLAGWLFIITRKPFSLGDRVQIDNGQAGDVIDIGLSDFSVLEIGNWVDADQSTGRVLHLPNSYVFTKTIANYHQGFPYLWHEIAVELTFDSDWERGLEILQEIANTETEVTRKEQAEVIEGLAAQDQYLIRFRHLTPIVYLKKSTYALVLTVRYCCDPRTRRSTEMGLWKCILKAIAEEPGLTLAYPTQTLRGDFVPVNS